MSEDTKKTYPSIPANNWWALRKKFRSTIPREVTQTYLASALNMDAASARKNVLPSLRLIGLVDKDGKPTDLAVRWRDDGQYRQVCQAILESVYPQELKDLAPDTSVDRSTVQSWFANHLGVGEVAARKFTAFYFLLCDGNPQKETDGAGTTTKSRATVTQKRRKSAAIDAPAPQIHKPEVVAQQAEEPAKPPTRSILPAGLERIAPQIHFNIQVVLPENALPETYDAIFKSIATHLLGRGEE